MLCSPCGTLVVQLGLPVPPPTDPRLCARCTAVLVPEDLTAREHAARERLGQFGLVAAPTKRTVLRLIRSKRGASSTPAEPPPPDGFIGGRSW